MKGKLVKQVSVLVRSSGTARFLKKKAAPVQEQP